MTYNLLKKHNINCPCEFGDPALLISKFYTPQKLVDLKDKICVIPHLTNIEKYKHLSKTEYCVIEPTEHFTKIMDYITGFNRSNIAEQLNTYTRSEIIGFFPKAKEFQLFRYTLIAQLNCCDFVFVLCNNNYPSFGML